MNLKHLFAATACALFSLSGCVDKDNPPFPPGPDPEPVPAKRTVLIYMAANNSLSGFAQDDIKEMIEGMSDVTDRATRLLIYSDTNNSGGQLAEVTPKNGAMDTVVVKRYGTRNSVGVAETKEVFADVFANEKYLAESYGLVYWSHGEGWLPYPVPTISSRWVGQDLTGGDHRMNIDEFAQILQTAPHFDFILFDACFMHSIEVAYELRSFADYLLASPTEIPGPGARYDVLVPALFATGTDYAQALADAYYQPYAEKYNSGIGISNSNWTGGASIGVIQTARLEALAAATKQLLATAPNIDRQALRDQSFDYDRRGGINSYVGYFDLVDLMAQLQPDGAAYDQWKRAFNAAAPYFQTTPMNYSAVGGMFTIKQTDGVSCYIPSPSNTNTDVAYRSCAWYTAAGLDLLGW
ncbi:MAG: peptidase C11 [Prevotellaceae bacterium]|jgi:hypothetical protein|nr:peptidase C11 [Prevotellaceae bacterium]